MLRLEELTGDRKPEQDQAQLWAHLSTWASEHNKQIAEKRKHG